jgi:hypothetical protein
MPLAHTEAMLVTPRVATSAVVIRAALLVAVTSVGTVAGSMEAEGSTAVAGDMAVVAAAAKGGATP